MGRHALKFVDKLHTGGIGAGGHLVGVTGVPGDGGIQVLEETVPGHEGLSGASFLSGAAIEDHGAMELPGFDCILDGNGGTQAGGAQQIVPAALAAAVFHQRLLFGRAAFLGQAGQGIIFAQNTDAGASLSVGAAESGGNAAEIFRDMEALFLHQLHIGRGRLVFQHRELGVAPDLVAEVQDLRLLMLDDLIEFLLIHHLQHLL